MNNLKTTKYFNSNQINNHKNKLRVILLEIKVNHLH